MSNLHRSEIAVELGGERLVLRLSLQALAEIEAAIAPAGLAALADRFAEGQFVLQEIIILLGALARGGGQRISDAALAERLDAADLPALLAAIAGVFAAALPGEGAPAGPCRPQPAGRGARSSPSASAGCG